MKLVDIKAAADRVLLDVNHNIRIGDSIALAEWVRDLLDAPPSLCAQAVADGGRVFVKTRPGGITPYTARLLANHLLLAAEAAEVRATDGKAAP